MMPFLNMTDSGGVTVDRGLSRLYNVAVADRQHTFDTHQSFPPVDGPMPQFFPLSARCIQVVVRFVTSVQVRNRLIVVRVVTIISILLDRATTEPWRAPHAMDLRVMLV